jgi:hypothetical protein
LEKEIKSISGKMPDTNEPNTEGVYSERKYIASKGVWFDKSDHWNMGRGTPSSIFLDN